jgi:hypothetical protein
VQPTGQPVSIVSQLVNRSNTDVVLLSRNWRPPTWRVGPSMPCSIETSSLLSVSESFRSSRISKLPNGKPHDTLARCGGQESKEGCGRNLAAKVLSGGAQRFRADRVLASWRSWARRAVLSREQPNLAAQLIPHVSWFRQSMRRRGEAVCVDARKRRRTGKPKHLRRWAGGLGHSGSRNRMRAVRLPPAGRCRSN